MTISYRVELAPNRCMRITQVEDDLREEIVLYDLNIDQLHNLACIASAAAHTLKLREYE